MSAPGSLILVGGKDGRDGDRQLLERFLGLCGGPLAHVLVITTAGSEPERHREEYAEAFSQLRAGQASIFHTARRKDSDDPALLAALEDADGVYFSGGGQLRLVTTLGGTRFHARLRERYRKGLHVGGTSAGASALSAVMIAGGAGGRRPRQSSVKLSRGLGLLPGVIVDQHFRQRERIGRLVAAVMRHPTMLGFGIDEATAVEVDPAGHAAVFGAGALTVVDGSALVGARRSARISLAGIRLHRLVRGWRYDLTTRRAAGPRARRSSSSHEKRR